MDIITSTTRPAQSARICTRFYCKWLVFALAIAANVVMGQCTSVKQMHDHRPPETDHKQNIVPETQHYNRDSTATDLQRKPGCVIDYETLIDGYLRMNADASLFMNRCLVCVHLTKTYFYPHYVITPIGAPLQSMHADELQTLVEFSFKLVRPHFISCSKHEWHIQCSDGEHFVSELGLANFRAIDYTQHIKGSIDLVSSGVCSSHTFITSVTVHERAQYIYYSAANTDRTETREHYNVINWPFTRDQDKIVDICCGHQYALFLTQSGSVWGRGINSHGQIGQRKGIFNISTMLKIEYDVHDKDEIPKIIALACGYDHNLMIDSEHRLWVFGNTVKHGPIYKAKLHDWFMQNNIKIMHVSCGADQLSLCIDENGILFTFGSNTYGQCGTGAANPVQHHPFPFQASDLSFRETKVAYAECGPHHCVLLTADNQVITFGKNSNGECSTLLRHRKYIRIGHIVSRKYEMKIPDEDYIDHIVVSTQGTIIVIDMVKTRHLRITHDYHRLSGEYALEILDP